MNDKLQYATMLEIPVNTVNVTYKPIKKRRVFKKKVKNPDAVKEELLSMVNAETDTAKDAIEIPKSVEENETAEELVALSPDLSAAEEVLSEKSDDSVSATVHKKAKQPAFKFTAITAELVAVVALVAIIFLTNAFYSESAMNVFMRKVFSPTETEVAAEKTYDEFAPVINFNGEMALEKGVIVCSGSGSVYAPADGTVSSVIKEEDGTFTLNIAHSAVFSSTLSGLSYAYLGEGDTVFGNIPVGYVTDGGFTACFNVGDEMITDYTLKDNAVLWAV